MAPTNESKTHPEILLDSVEFLLTLHDNILYTAAHAVPSWPILQALTSTGIAKTTTV